MFIGEYRDLYIYTWFLTIRNGEPSHDKTEKLMLIGYEMRSQRIINRDHDTLGKMIVGIIIGYSWLYILTGSFTT